MTTGIDVISTYYPEAKINGYTSIDGSVEFYTRVNSILHPSMTVLDFGAGRAAWYEDDQCYHRRTLRTIKGKVKKLIGCDIDQAVFENNSLDEQVKIKIGESLPFPDGSFDMIISDYTFEHVDNPDEVATELHRILKKGGWICARTPNKYSYISLITRLVKNSYHQRILKFTQPSRKAFDVFPTRFKLNSLSDISKHFNKDRFENFTYRYEAEPSYHFNKKVVFSLMMALDKFSPSAMKVNLFIFLRKK